MLKCVYAFLLPLAFLLEGCSSCSQTGLQDCAPDDPGPGDIDKYCSYTQEKIDCWKECSCDMKFKDIEADCSGDLCEKTVKDLMEVEKTVNGPLCSETDTKIKHHCS
jgi:hypothetical protein